MTIPEQKWVFTATLRRVIDGDTLDMDIDQGMHAHRIERLRLLRVNAPEMHGDTKVAGEASKNYVIAWFDALLFTSGSSIVIQTYKSDVFGRYLAEVWRTSDGANLADDLLAAGMAVPF